VERVHLIRLVPNSPLLDIPEFYGRVDTVHIELLAIDKELTRCLSED
jgi:hypothetical protein